MTALLILLSALSSGCTGTKSQDYMPQNLSENKILREIDENASSAINQTENTNSPDKTESQNETQSFEENGYNSLYPQLIADKTKEDEYEKRTFTTKFQKSEYDVTFDVNMSVLNGAANANKSLAFHIAREPEEVQVSYYKSFFEGPENDIFLNETLKKLRHIKIANSFSDEEYLEYLIAFVQQIPYDNYAQGTRFPVEVIYDKTGDCDEKSMLLIGLLEKSGYDVALILFPKQGHAVAGIRIIPGGDTNFRMYRSDDGRKYLFIEATSPSYIGLYPDEYEDANAVVIPIGENGRSYNNYNYVAYIVGNKKKIENRILYFEKRLNEIYDEAVTLEEKLNNPQKYYNTQEEYDSDYLKYSGLANEFREIHEYYLKNIEVYEYIVNYPYDVEGVRRTIYNSKVNDIEY
ncbi:hypothetical protein J2128_001679 [Methanomicrobium sp. W14]|uniref:hypothetical protein n=1 Tax=Methanomicrobium sp. W14 TaxID=2817839 RepID=UPI001AE69DF6|nr:hypothetical protein [Methanomicrobium sp. W14]MBP2133725.1 hypothetical protein [Methanomicrobium sp. W14]